MHNLRRSLSYLSIVHRQAWWSCSRLASSTTGNEEIQIPNRIPRSPTDILRALSQTVGSDPTAAHYKYHDDPFLIPTSSSSKRNYALAQESGRNSAKWIIQENSQLFQVSSERIFISCATIKEVASILAYGDGSANQRLHSSQSLH